MKHLAFFVLLSIAACGNDTSGGATSPGATTAPGATGTSTGSPAPHGAPGTGTVKLTLRTK